MSKLYSIVSFNFGDYDLVREPTVIDNNAEYIYVTDKPVESKVWNVVIDESLASADPLYASYYVRYHAYKYASTHTVFVVDGTLTRRNTLREIRLLNLV